MSAVTRSLLPSPLKSPTATEQGAVPAPKAAWPETCRCRCRAARSRCGVAVVRDSQVALAVAVEVAHSHGTEASLRWRRTAGLKRAVAVAEQHARGATLPVVLPSRQVPFAVAVEIGHCALSIRARLRAEGLVGLKRAVAGHARAGVLTLLESFTKSEASAPTPAWTATSPLPKSRIPSKLVVSRIRPYSA